MNFEQVWWVLCAMMVVTFALRALPFLAAHWLQKHSVVKRLGDFLPLAIMTLLVLHSGVSAAMNNPLGPWPEIVAVTITATLQWRWKNPLLSIVCGTTLYVAWCNTGI